MQPSQSRKGAGRGFRCHSCHYLRPGLPAYLLLVTGGSGNAISWERHVPTWDVLSEGLSPMSHTGLEVLFSEGLSTAQPRPALQMPTAQHAVSTLVGEQHSVKSRHHLSAGVPPSLPFAGVLTALGFCCCCFGGGGWVCILFFLNIFSSIC
jgi:hypothetical protein